MKRFCFFAACLILICVLLVSCASTGNRQKDELSILFIGNSFTYGNNLPWLFGNICESCGYSDIRVDSVMMGSYTLEMYCDPENKYCRQIEDMLSETAYDIVILQEQSIRPINSYDKFHDAAATLTEKARANGARVLLYETWGYAEGYPDLKYNGWTTSQMESLLAEAYTRLAEELGVEVVYCGSVMADMYSKGTDIPLYHKDLKHPGIGGSYLVALTFFNYIFGEDTTKVPYQPKTLTDEQSAVLKQEVMDFFHR